MRAVRGGLRGLGPDKVRGNQDMARRSMLSAERTRLALEHERAHEGLWHVAQTHHLALGISSQHFEVAAAAWQESLEIVEGSKNSVSVAYRDSDSKLGRRRTLITPAGR